MMTQTKNIEQLKLIFEEYLEYISQFYTIKNYTPWVEKAIKNLSLRAHNNEHIILELTKGNSIIGFAIISNHLRFNTDGLAISEFYIKKKHARVGNGRKLAEFAFDKYPGTWEVAVDRRNHAGHHFWENVISKYTNNEFIKKQNQGFDGMGYLFHNYL